MHAPILFFFFFFFPAQFSTAHGDRCQCPVLSYNANQHIASHRSYFSLICFSIGASSAGRGPRSISTCSRYVVTKVTCLPTRHARPAAVHGWNSQPIARSVGFGGAVPCACLEGGVVSCCTISTLPSQHDDRPATPRQCREGHLFFFFFSPTTTTTTTMELHDPLRSASRLVFFSFFSRIESSLFFPTINHTSMPLHCRYQSDQKPLPRLDPSTPPSSAAPSRRHARARRVCRLPLGRPSVPESRQSAPVPRHRIGLGLGFGGKKKSGGGEDHACLRPSPGRVLFHRPLSSPSLSPHRLGAARGKKKKPRVRRQAGALTTD